MTSAKKRGREVAPIFISNGKDCGGHGDKASGVSFIHFSKYFPT